MIGKIKFWVRCWILDNWFRNCCIVQNIRIYGPVATLPGQPTFLNHNIFSGSAAYITNRPIDESEPVIFGVDWGACPVKPQVNKPQRFEPQPVKPVYHYSCRQCHTVYSSLATVFAQCANCGGRYAVRLDT